MCKKKKKKKTAFWSKERRVIPVSLSRKQQPFWLRSRNIHGIILRIGIVNNLYACKATDCKIDVAVMKTNKQIQILKKTELKIPFKSDNMFH